MLYVRVARSGGWFAGIAAVFLFSEVLRAAPVIPGVDHLAANGGDEAFLGEILIGELACSQCHQAAQKRLWGKEAPDLSAIGSRVTPQYLRRFLASPHEVKPGATMPDLFHSSAPAERERSTEELAHFLASFGGPILFSQTGGTLEARAWGEELFHTTGCAACHGPQEGARLERFKPLGDLASKTTVDALAQFLLNPREIRPSGRMPSLWLNEDEARAISVYLLRAQLDAPQSRNAPPVLLPGLNVDYYEADSLQKLPDFAAIEPAEKGTVESITINLPFRRRSNHYALRFHGQILAPKKGEYRFATHSDDGSAMFIDGKIVVDNDGTHGMQRREGRHTLEAGTHAFELVYFNGGGGGGLQVFWDAAEQSGQWQPLPRQVFRRSGGLPMVPLGSAAFRVNAAKAAAGKQKFQTLGCASCHRMDDAPPVFTAKSLNELDIDSDDGCLSVKVRRGLPDYRLSKAQRRQMLAALESRRQFAQPRPAEEQVKKTLAVFNCYACHRRDGVGGPESEFAAQYFHSIGDIDLGEEAKVPPALDFVGAKLKPAAIQSILSSQALHVRRIHMKTRMPNFGLENLSAFVRHIGSVDGGPESDSDPPFLESDARIGRDFVGTKIGAGLACVTCHQIAGQNALAIQGIDLADTYDRIQFGWFEQFMLHPARFKPGTRMPQFWFGGQSPFPNILDGNAKKQIQAIWSYLSLKNSLPLPEGIVPEGAAAMEIVPVETPIVHRTFMQDVGPRAILAGFPEKLSVAFDANVVRLAQVWRGRFFDHSGVESGRTDKFLGPLGEDILDLPPGPSFARLQSPHTSWPVAEKTSRDVGGRFLGYRLGNDRRPTFRYQLGSATIEEQAEPILRPGGAVLKRSFQIRIGADNALYFLAAQGASIADRGKGNYEVNDAIRIQLKTSPEARPFIRMDGENRQLLVPIPTGNGTASITQIIAW